MTLQKNSGSGTDYDAQVYSTIGYTGGCHLKFKKLTPNMAAFSGISCSPDTAASHYEVDYAWSAYENSNAYLWSKGVDVGGVPYAYNANDIFEIIYDNSTVKYYHNSIEKHSINVPSGLTFYLSIRLRNTGINAGRIISWKSTDTTTHSTKLNSYNIEKTNKSFYLDSSFYNTGCNQVQILQFTENYDKNKLGKNSITIPESKSPEIKNSNFTIEFWAQLSSSVGGQYSSIYLQGIQNMVYSESVGKALHISYYKQGTDIKIQLDFYDKYHVVIVNSIYVDTFSHYAFVFKTTLWIFYGFVILAITIIFLLIGQRIAKDYVAASQLVPYFILILLGIMSMY